ncbi:MAG: 4Fe-4S dicluster domain-containing protein [Candidatus Lokiarchaeota archaeon]|jgi:2-oxoglutarate ferredoxin oxidoreductase subunit delta|nr:4Fe-4S dicluster domain-containing protein [Candidatus Lokiarchaeota archaeon]MBD3198892.1 4Fe-4S dicluster domain-containing protein [Candidatus Lokiarchaeota archaeon]
MDIKIKEEYCKGCEYCIEVCPQEIFQKSKRYNEKGYNVPELNNSKSCTGCKKCELICPEMAITISKEEENKKK